jgi:uncharacterized membrane-anchored protein
MVHFLKVAARVERRLNAIQNELRMDRDRNAYDRYDELMNLSTDLRQVRASSNLLKKNYQKYFL